MQNIIARLAQGFLGRKEKVKQVGTGKIYVCRYDMLGAKCTEDKCFGSLGSYYVTEVGGCKTEWTSCTRPGCTRRERRWYYFTIQEGVDFKTYSTPPYSDSFFTGYTVKRGIPAHELIEEIQEAEVEKGATVEPATELPMVDGKRIILVNKGWGMTEDKRWVPLPVKMAESLGANDGKCKALVRTVQVYPGKSAPAVVNTPSNNDVGYYGTGAAHYNSSWYGYPRCNEHGFPIPDPPRTRPRIARSEVALYGKEGKVEL